MTEPGSGVLAVVLAGGRGTRLMPLTAHRAKPDVPFGARHRIIDFVLSNLVNGGCRDILVITQYRNESLDGYLRAAWHGRSVPQGCGSGTVRVTPLSSRQVPGGSTGSADALYRNLDVIEAYAPAQVLLFGADHVYRMDPRPLLGQHTAQRAGVTVAAVRQPLARADQFGVIEAAACGTRIAAFREKPKDATGLPDAPDQVYASMGNYAWRADTLADALRADAADPDSGHDVGGDLIPAMVARGVAGVYDFSAHRLPGSRGGRGDGYWRDVGTLDEYHAAHMDVLGDEPVFDLDDPHWPIGVPTATAWFGPQSAAAAGSGCLIAPNATVAGTVHRSVLAPGVRVDRSARVESSVLMGDVHVGAGSVIRNAVVDHGIHLAPGTRIGVEARADRERYTVTDRGVVVVGRAQAELPESFSVVLAR